MTDEAKVQIGYVGLGSMGAAMVSALLDAGLTTVVYDLDPAAVDAAVAKGALAATDGADLARRCGVVSVCVPADAHVRAVLDGPDGVLAHLEPGSTVAIHSTVLPETVHWAAEAAAARGIGLVEAPVTGGDAAALTGELTFLLAGEDSACDALEPLLGACGKERIRVDRLGDATRLKLCINLNTYLCFLGAAESSRLARGLGIDPELVHRGMDANGQISPILRRFLPIHTFDDATIADEGLQQMLASNLAIIAKDLGLIGEAAAAAGTDLPVVPVLVDHLATTYRVQT